MSPKEHWKIDPDEHDYPAARDFLSLVLPEPVASALADALKAAPLSVRKAKDLLRASGLRPLPETNAHVAGDLDKVHTGEHLSPVLLVRGNVAGGIPLIIADGYHRICASYLLDENADIPCRMVDLPEAPR